MRPEVTAELDGLKTWLKKAKFDHLAFRYDGIHCERFGLRKVVASCCTPTGRLFSHFARSYRRRFKKKGLERSQEQLMAGVSEAGVKGERILEIGCGVGYFHFLLLDQGATGAVGVDLSEQMIQQAREFAIERGHSDRTEYHLGDFTEIAESLPAADVTVLDKVVCCYPDPETLVTTSTQRTRKVYALTYPRWRWITRASFACLCFLLWVSRSKFRPFVHHPQKVEALITTAGFTKAYQASTIFWLTQVYRKNAVDDA